jgi:hypothetical protein
VGGASPGARRGLDSRPVSRSRQLLLMALALAAGTAVAELLGAANMGVALGVGQLVFAGTLVWLLMTN